MLKKKINIAIVTGGTSSEVNIALKGAEVIHANLDKEKYQAYQVLISDKIWTVSAEGGVHAVDKNDFSFTLEHKKVTFDCVFIIVHGKPAENGMLQGYFNLLGIPFTCSGVFASALTYNKQACKRFLKELPLALAESVIVRSLNDVYMADHLNYPVFVKPNQEGSSYGISKVSEPGNLSAAVELALKYDKEVMIEEAISGVEVTCGMMIKNGEVIAFPLTEIVSKKDFFDYEAKYEGASEEITPARIDPEYAETCKSLSITIYKELKCKGLVRVDYILTNGTFYLLEVNTIPGLTKESIVPQQAAAYGLSLAELFDLQIKECLTSDYPQITT